MTVFFSLLLFMLSLLPSLLLSNYGKAQSEARDTERKSDINAIHAQLEQHYAINYEYPTEQEVLIEYDYELPGLAEDSLFDPNGYKINDPAGSYQYTPTECSAIGCKHYTITARLEDKSAYQKKSLK